MIDQTYLIRNLERLPNRGGPRDGEVEPYWTSRSDGLPLAITREMVDPLQIDVECLEATPAGAVVSMEWIEGFYE